MTIRAEFSPPELLVIMSVFNEKDCVAIAIDSIIAQSYEQWHLVIVDDGSTDGTAEVVQAYVEQYNNITLLKNIVNRGLAYGLNKAVNVGDSQYVARMDADDVALPDRFQAQLNYLKEHPEVDVLGTGAEVVGDSNRTNVFKPEHHNDIVKSIEKINPFFHSSVMMRRSFIESKGGYDVQCLRAQDYDLWLRGVDNSRYHNLPEVLMVYASRNQSFQSIFYGFRVRVVNAYRRGRVMVGLYKAVLVLVYGLGVKLSRSVK